MKKGWIQTFTGKKFYPLDPDPEQICIEDIAHSLSLQCRFSGHTKRFYSVAEHSVEVARNWFVDPDHREPRTGKLMALLHDASEAYLSDIPRPLKLLPEFAFYREAEEHLQWMIWRKFGVGTIPIRDMAHLESADRLMCVTEAHSEKGMAPIHPDWDDDGLKPVPHINIACLRPESAESLFLSTFFSLTDKEKYEADLQSRSNSPAKAA